MIFKNMQKNKAFTLIDILISVAIVSLLSSIVLFNVTEGKSKAEDSHMTMESGQVATALELYKLDNNGFTPLSVQSVGYSPTPHPEGSDNYNVAMGTLVAEGYLEELPRSPSGSSYAYGESEDGKSAVFVANTNTDKDENICKTVGNSNFGRTGNGDSCKGIIDDDDENEPRFTDNNDGTVTDNSTGLVWMQETDAALLWQDAVTYCQTNAQGLPGSGWRLPSIGELQSIVDLSQGLPPMDPVFTYVRLGSYWSSTEEAGRPTSAWYYHMGEQGTAYAWTIGKWNGRYAVLCVR